MDAVATTITAVTVYASGARITRAGTVPAGAATPITTITIGGLPLALIDDTARATISRGTIRAVHVHADAPATAAADALPDESAELAAARRATRLAAAEVDRLTAAIAALDDHTVVAEVADEHAPRPPWGDVLAARRALVAIRTARELALREQHVAAARAAREAAEHETVIADRDRRAGGALAPKLHELRKVCVLEVVGEVAGATVALEYQITAARWAPTYVARLDNGGAARFEIRAVVAQATGEAWDGVALELSTAEPHRFAPLPELAPQRIGRRQDVPARTGFRAPPVGAAALYADYERAFPPPAPPQPPIPGPANEIDTNLDDLEEFSDHLSDQVWDEDSSRSKEAFDAPAANRASSRETPKRGMAMAMAKSMTLVKRKATAVSAPSAAPMPQPQQRFRAQHVVADGSPEQELGGFGAAGGGAPRDIDVLANISSAPPPPRLDYTGLRMGAPSSPHRGHLVPAPADPSGPSAVARAAAAQLAQLALPPGCTAAWPHSYDYAFVADGQLAIAADGAWCSVPLVQRPCTAKVRHVAVPREQADAFRVAAIANPFAAPLLPGPIDVYDRGQFLLTSAVDFTPPGATVDVGLGVDPLVKIARNIEFREEAAGMLRGALRLHHAISIEVDNRGARPIDLEIRERVPVAREGDDDVEIVVGRVEPAWERWTPDPDAPAAARLRGAYRWRVALEPGRKAAVRAAYEVKIASKYELVGGNRREA